MDLSICASRRRANCSPVLVRMVTGLDPEVDARLDTKPVWGQVKQYGGGVQRLEYPTYPSCSSGTVLGRLDRLVVGGLLGEAKVIFPVPGLGSIDIGTLVTGKVWAARLG
jgi:hypothetical protein